jgi:hypothetical protein
MAAPTPTDADQPSLNTTIIENLSIALQANPELLLGGIQLKSMGEQAWTAMKSRYAGGATSFINNVSNQALKKADEIFNFQQNLVSSIGSQTEAYDNMATLQQGVYDLNLLHSGSLAGTGIGYKRFFEDEKQMLEEFNKIIDDNLLLTHFAGNATQDQIAELPILARALGFRHDMMQTFMRRQFAITGEANDDLLQSTLAHALAAEKATGISSKIITAHVGVMMTEVSLFGDMTEAQMTRAAVEVAQLGLEMSTVTNMVRGFNDFESAAGNVAKLTQALGIQVDVMDAVALANENPDQLMQMFRQQFDIAGIDVHSLSMPMKRALADIFGARDTQEVEQMFGNASSGLSEFLAQADEGLATVGDPEVDQALAMAASNLERRRILEGDARSMGAAFGRNIEQAMSSAMASTMNRQKERLDTMTVDLMQSQGSMIQQGVMDPLMNSFEGASNLMFGELENMITGFEARLTTFIDEVRTHGIEDAWGNLMQTPTAAERTASVASVAAANLKAAEFIGDYNSAAGQAYDPALTPERFEYLTHDDFVAISTAIKDDGLGLTSEKLEEVLARVADTWRDAVGNNNVIEIGSGADGIVISVGTGPSSSVEIPVTVKTEP